MTARVKEFKDAWGWLINILVLLVLGYAALWGDSRWVSRSSDESHEKEQGDRFSSFDRRLTVIETQNNTILSEISRIRDRIEKR